LSDYLGHPHGGFQTIKNALKKAFIKTYE